jgi:hypothetical protein
LPAAIVDPVPLCARISTERFMYSVAPVALTTVNASLFWLKYVSPVAAVGVDAFGVN